MRFRPVRLQSGAVIQSGINAQDRSTLGPNVLDPKRRPFRGVVVNSRVIGEAGQVRNLSVEVDVLLVRTNLLVQNVPVAQRQHGVNNVHDLWVPRATTRVLSASDSIPVATDTTQRLNLDRQLSARGTLATDPPTALNRVDGDMVLLDFIEGDLNWPIVTHALPHERTNRLLRQGDGWREGSTAERGEARRDEHYTHHYGCELRINEQGDLLIDTVGAYSDPVTESAAGATGQVRVRVKDSVRFTVAMGDDEDVFEVFKDGNQLRIDLGENATERLVLGDSFLTLYNAHTHPTGTGPSGPPQTPMSAAQHLSEVAKTKQS